MSNRHVNFLKYCAASSWTGLWIWSLLETSWKIMENPLWGRPMWNSHWRLSLISKIKECFQPYVFCVDKLDMFNAKHLYENCMYYTQCSWINYNCNGNMYCTVIFRQMNERNCNYITVLFVVRIFTVLIKQFKSNKKRKTRREKNYWTGSNKVLLYHDV